MAPEVSANTTDLDTHDRVQVSSAYMNVYIAVEDPFSAQHADE